MSKKGKVVVAMSGGVDSSVVAMMLADEGYEVIGITMKTWDYATSGGSKKETGCCSLDSINDARAVGVKFGFPHYVLDIRKEFGTFVIDDFVDEYLDGRTPNPCVLCNTHIKWEALLKRADMLDAEFIATGHYANVRKHKDRFVVSKGADGHKDQSYVLWGLSQESLSRSMFPLGKYQKKEVKDIAVHYGFDELASKSESYEICFVPDNDYRGFLKRKVDGLEEKLAGGDFVTTSGEVVGKHKGYPFYTIGQRKGLELAMGEPMYVTNINPDTNTVIIGKREELDRNGMYVGKLNMVKYETIENEFEAVTKIRNSHSGTICKLYPEKKRIKVVFNAAASGIAPGQSAVFYEGDDVLAGGIIQKGFMLDKNDKPVL